MAITKEVVKDCPMCRGVGSHGEPPIYCKFCNGTGKATHRFFPTLDPEIDDAPDWEND